MNLIGNFRSRVYSCMSSNLSENRAWMFVRPWWSGLCLISGIVWKFTRKLLGNLHTIGLFLARLRVHQSNENNSKFSVFQYLHIHTRFVHNPRALPIHKQYKIPFSFFFLFSFLGNSTEQTIFTRGQKTKRFKHKHNIYMLAESAWFFQKS